MKLKKSILIYHISNSKYDIFLISFAFALQTQTNSTLKMNLKFNMVFEDEHDECVIIESSIIEKFLYLILKCIEQDIKRTDIENTVFRISEYRLPENPQPLNTSFPEYAETAIENLKEYIQKLLYNGLKENDENETENEVFVDKSTNISDFICCWMNSMDNQLFKFIGFEGVSILLEIIYTCSNYRPLFLDKKDLKTIRKTLEFTKCEFDIFRKRYYCMTPHIGFQHKDYIDAIEEIEKIFKYKHYNTESVMSWYYKLERIMITRED